MSRLTAAALGVWEFVVGDDWSTAAGVVVAIALTALIAEETVAAWAVMPAVVILALALSLWRSLGGASVPQGVLDLRPPPSAEGESR